MNKNELTVVIPLSDYVAAIEDRAKLEALVDAAIASADLGYSGEHLRFDADILNALLAAVAPYTYKGRIKELQEEKVRERIEIETNDGVVEV